MRIPSLLPVLALLIFGCSSFPKSSELPVGKFERIPLIGKFTAERTRLENGLTLVIVQDHSSPTFAYQTWFKVGSRNETPGYTGLAHLFEHMMFKGTKNMKDGEFDRILESAGAEGNNAFTSRDYTAYVQELPIDAFDLISRVEADRMVNLIIDDQAFKTEREVVQNERRFRMENSADGLMYQEIFGLAFTQHPYKWPVIGYPEDLERMSAVEARAFYTTHYAPNLATVVVVGDVEPNQVLATVKKNYGPLPPSAEAPPVSPITSEPPQKSPKHKTLKLNIQVEKLMMGYRIPEATHPDAAAVSVVRSLLAGGKSSRLHRALVDTGISSGVDCYDIDDRDPSLFIIASNLQKGHKAAQAESVILRELSRLTAQVVSAQELERSRNIMNFAFYDDMGSSMEKANFIGRYSTIAGSFEKGLEIFGLSQKVTGEDVKRVAALYLRPANRSVIIGAPKGTIPAPVAQSAGGGP